MFRFSLCVLFVLAVELVRETEYGRVQGDIQLGKVIKFSKIPFAAPPLANKRWRRPVPPSEWHDIYHDTAPSVVCPSRIFSSTSYSDRQNEDCLYLDIYAPSEVNTTDSTSVLVSFPGDGFRIGNMMGLNDATLELHEIITQQNFIVVIVNYRLDIFGFLGHHEFAKEDSDLSTGNYGLMDQIFALQWVKRNIANFGGDPSKVTLHGQGIGATSICTMLTKPETFGLYRNVIMESPDCGSGIFHHPLEVRTQYSELHTKSFSRCDIDFLGGERWKKCLRNASTTDLIMPQNSEAPIFDPEWTRKNPLTEIFPWALTIDGSPAGIVDTPINIIRKKLWAGVPILGGYKQNDGSVFTPLFQSKPSDKRIDSDSLLSLMNRFYPYSSDSAKVVADYLNKQQDRMLSLHASEAKNETSSEDDFYMVLRDQMFKCQFRDFLLLASAEAPVYHYISESNSNANMMKQIFGQTEAHAHSWGHPFFPSRIRSRTIQEIPSNIQKYWANFAARSSPDSDDLEPWPQFNQSELIMSISESTRTKQSPHTSECNFFNVVEITSTTQKARHIVTEEEEEKSPFWSGFLFSILLFLLCILSCRIVAGTALK